MHREPLANTIKKLFLSVLASPWFEIELECIAPSAPVGAILYISSCQCLQVVLCACALACILPLNSALVGASCIYKFLSVFASGSLCMFLGLHELILDALPLNSAPVGASCIYKFLSVFASGSLQMCIPAVHGL